MLTRARVRALGLREGLCWGSQPSLPALRPLSVVLPPLWRRVGAALCPRLWEEGGWLAGPPCAAVFSAFPWFYFVKES